MLGVGEVYVSSHEKRGSFSKFLTSVKIMAFPLPIY